MKAWSAINSAHQDRDRWFRLWMVRVCSWLFACSTFLIVGPWARAEVSYSRSAKFRIPFEFNAEELTRLKVREVQLHVSMDHGQTWQMAGAVPPQQGFVLFESPTDGDYWFSVKTVSEGGSIRPRGNHQTTLEVTVDTVPPSLELQLDEIEPGRVRLAWKSEDLALNVDSLQLEYLDQRTGSWHAVGVRPADSGQTIWSVDGGNSVTVRGRIQDRAGNEQSAAQTLTLKSVANRSEDLALLRPAPGNSGLPEIAASNRPLAVPTRGSLNPNDCAASTLPEVRGQERFPELPALPTPASSGAPALPLIDQTSTTVANQPTSTGRTEQRLVNSNQFRIDYGFKSVGPSGVKAVNLYITEDGGQKWYHYDADPDRRSPIEVVVPDDGVYGFAFRVESGVGLVTPPPQPGDPPEVTIVVDQIAPTVQLLPFTQGTPVGQVAIDWVAADQDLLPRPVALYYSNAPTGPWVLIDGNLPNTGHFDWTLPRLDATERLYMRIEVRDRAGNIGRQDSKQPLIVDFSRPAVEVLGIEVVPGVTR